MTQEEVNRRIELHELWLKTSKTEGQLADFSGKDLRLIDFSGKDLRGSIFDKADLRGARFALTNLKDASFFSACLRCVNFEDANARKTNFANADFGCAILKGTFTDGAIFQNAKNIYLFNDGEGAINYAIAHDGYLMVSHISFWGTLRDFEKENVVLYKDQIAYLSLLEKRHCQ
jgi:uncharacterized protein YjbI with pentapeptide repeats